MSEAAVFLTLNGAQLAQDVAGLLVRFEALLEVGRAARLEAAFRNEGFALSGRALFAHGDRLGATLVSGEASMTLGGFEVLRVAGGRMVRVVAYDALAALGGSARSRLWSGRSYDEIARQVAQEHGLDCQATPVPWRAEQTSQVNESDAAFLARLAARVGYELRAAGRKLVFGPPDYDATPVDRLTWAEQGGLLVEFDPVESLLAVPASVTVAGLDPWTGRAYEATVRSGAETALGPAAHAEDLGVGAAGLRYATAEPIRAAAEAEARAIWEAEHRELTRARFRAIGSPRLVAGALVEVVGVGARFDGLYRIRSARHVVGDSYTVTGTLERNAAGLLAAKTAGRPARTNHRWAPTGRRVAG